MVPKDFVLNRRGKPPIVLECTWAAGEFDPANVRAFVRLYPQAPVFVVSHDVDRPFGRRYGQVSVRFIALSSLAETLLDVEKSER